MTDFASPLSTITALNATIPNASTAQNLPNVGCRVLMLQNRDASASVHIGDSSVTSAGLIAHTYHTVAPGAVLTLEVNGTKQYWYISSGSYTGPFLATAYS